MSKKKKYLLASGGLLIIVLICVLSYLAGRSDDNDKIKQLEERYNTEFEYVEDTTERILFDDDRKYTFTVKCKDLPGKLVTVSSYEEWNIVESDYIFQKFGDEVCNMIKDSLLPVVPDAKIVPMVIKAGSKDEYDANTTIDDYLANEGFIIYIILNGDIDTEKLTALVDECADKLKWDGINCAELEVYVCDGSYYDSVTDYSCIVLKEDFGDVPADMIKDKEKK